MANRCEKCNVNASNRELLRCFGSCKRAYHPGCIDYKMDQYAKFIKECPYAKFVCLECQNEAEGKIVLEMNDLKSIVHNLSTTVESLVSKVDIGFAALSSELEEKSKIEKACNQQHTLTAADNHNTNCDRQPIIGTATPDNIIKSVSLKKKQYLHVSRLHPETNANDVKAYIASKLKLPISDIDCWPLISKDRDISTLKFISFKLGIMEEKLYDALSANIWPVGTTVRRFIFYDRQKNGIRIAALHQTP